MHFPENRQTLDPIGIWKPLTLRAGMFADAEAGVPPILSRHRFISSIQLNEQVLEVFRRQQAAPTILALTLFFTIPPFSQPLLFTFPATATCYCLS